MFVFIGKIKIMTINRKIIIHWTGGTLTPNNIEREHYHYLIGYKDGKPFIEKGLFSVEDNDNCYDGKYAQHTGGGNTGAIGIAICGMLGYKGKHEIGKYPFNEAQFDKMCRLVAEVSLKYRIPINKALVMTHYEFGLKHTETSSAGKPDISFLPFNPTMKAEKIGNYIRETAECWFTKLFK